MAEVLPSDELVEEPSDYGAMQPGTRLGRYELLVPIARGGMARVWAARMTGQRGFQKLVALKTILPHLAEEPEFERMFLDEARIASGVHHPNVCEIYELGEEQRTLYLAMEWVSGDSLARVLRASGKTEAADPRVMARVIADACAGLHAAHELTDEEGRPLGVVHRDLSPHNILLTADGTAKVADFGVAKALGQLHEATSAGQLKGKIAYMAPEQVTGAGIDRRSDVFSLGCVLYEATTGQRPFRGDGDHQVMHSVLKGEVAPPTSLLRGYPQELERIVMRALSPQPILRYPTAERMRFALEEFLARGQLVTQSNVAQVVRARIGESIDRRKERIRQASTAGDREGGWSEPPGNMTPSNQAHGGHRSGVKASGANAPRHLSTIPMDRPGPPNLPSATPQMHGVPAIMGPASSATIPHAQPPFAPPHQGHTPASHPGAGYSYPGQPGPRPQPAATFGNPLAQTALMPPTASLPPVMSLPPNLEVSGFDAASGNQGMPMSPFPMAPPGAPSPSSPLQMPPLGQHTFPPGSNAFGPPPGPPNEWVPAPPHPPQGDRASRPPAGAGQYVAAIGVGVLLAVVIGVGGYYAWHKRHAPVAEPTPPAVTPVPVPVPVPVVGGASTSTVAAAASGSPTSTASADITFRVVPAEATLSVDGVDLVGDLRTVPRPAMGKTVTVVARAKGFEDVTLLVDFFTMSPMELTLKSVAPGVPPVGEPAPATPEEAKDPPKDPPKKDAKPQKPVRDPALPPNPF
jgi:serine/threonine-protein kinase